MKAAVLNKGSPGSRVLWLALFVLILLVSSPAFAATYYVSTSGNDGAAGTQAAPFRTIARGSRALASGDTLYIRAGTYAEAMYHGLGGFTFRSGTSMNAMTRYAAYPGEEGKVIVKPPGGNIVVFMGGHSYIEIKGLVLDAVNTTGGAVVITREKDIHNRIVDNEIKNGRQGGGGNHEIIGNKIHHMRSYGIYTGEDNGLVEGNIFHDNGGYAIHLFQQSHAVNNWVIRNNVFFNNGRGYYFEDAGVPQLRKVQAVLISRGTNNQFYNNLVYNNYSGVFVGMGASDTLVANNTVYGNDLIGIDISSDHNGSRNARIINNIVWGNKSSQIRNTGTNTTLQNNLTTDPKVVNAADGDFHLTSGSTAAIDKGQTLSSVPNDFAYGKQPFGSAYDIGAFEFGAPPGQNPSSPIASGGGTNTAGTTPCPPSGGGGGTTGGGGTDGAGQPSTAGSTFYISPGGRDSNNGTSPSTPWRTFSYALNAARAWCGDTLVLLDGTYSDGAGTGKIDINNATCTAGNALTVKAQNQRKAKIVDNGNGSAVRVTKSAYIIIDGLYARSTDNPGASGGEPFTVRDSNHVTVRNTVGRNPNRVNNMHMYDVLRSQDVLLEDNEAYVFHRHCVVGWESERVVVRRQYCNALGGKIPGGFSAGGASLGTGDTVFSMYPCKDCILENSIADSTTTPSNLNEMNATFGNNVLMSGSKVLGSICYKCSHGNGIYPNSRKAPNLDHTPQNITIRNVAFVDFSTPSAAIRASDGVNMDIGQITVLGVGWRGSGITGDDSANGATPAQQSIVIRDSTIQGRSVGFNKAPNAYSTWSGNNLNSYNNGVAFTPGLPGNWGATTTINPELDGCKVWIPATSPLKEAGTGGGDIGANILYRYVNGTLTNTPLWDPATGAFPHGEADLDGTNRVVGQSLFDIHLRLGINSPGCPFPANYASGGARTPELPPAPGMGNSAGDSGSLGCNTIKIVTENESCVKAGETVPLSIKLVDAVTNQPITPPGDVYISSIPPGFRLSAGTVFQTTPVGAVYELTPAQLSSLAITPPPGYDGILTMSISYTPPVTGATAATTP